LFDEQQQNSGWVTSHVDDFLFGGRENDPRWELAKGKIKDRFKFGEWERGIFTQCGVTKEQRGDFSFTLQQPEFLEQVCI
jgi:hypothetical protein